MSSIVVSDAGPLIALAKIGLLPEFFQAFGDIYITKCVEHEATFDQSKPGAKVIRNAILCGDISVKSVAVTESLKSFLTVLDKGEAESIELAHRLGVTALIDETAGRKVAKKQKVKLMGSGAVLIVLKRKGLIREIRPYLSKMRNVGYRLSQAIEDKLIELASE